MATTSYALIEMEQKVLNFDTLHLSEHLLFGVFIVVIIFFFIKIIQLATTTLIIQSPTTIKINSTAHRVWKRWCNMSNTHRTRTCKQIQAPRKIAHSTTVAQQRQPQHQWTRKKKLTKTKENTQIALYHKIKCKIQDKVEFDHIFYLICALSFIHSRCSPLATWFRKANKAATIISESQQMKNAQWKLSTRNAVALVYECNEIALYGLCAYICRPATR